MLYDGCAFDCDGAQFLVSIKPDEEWRTPWQDEDGHGPVTDWTRREKRPGELVLAEDRGSFLYYDFQEACAIARRDGWGAAGDDGMTPHQKAAHAARADFERLRRYCAGLWGYVGLVVTMLDDYGDPMPYEASIWGVESDADEYLDELANELADEVQSQIASSLAA
jgi:hypothetical protein